MSSWDLVIVAILEIIVIIMVKFRKRLPIKVYELRRLKMIKMYNGGDTHKFICVDLYWYAVTIGLGSMYWVTCFEDESMCCMYLRYYDDDSENGYCLGIKVFTRVFHIDIGKYTKSYLNELDR